MNSKEDFNTPGERYQDFEVGRVIEIPELQCILRELVHLPTGAQIMHIENEDPENLFCLSFQTRPSNSNGAAHILEHTVLCGSKKFPVKDPFFSMTRRSLNTFMNALTGSDFTCYPAATQVPKDFYNLLDVYIDAVFNPLLTEFSFRQEGHRLEFAIPNDPLSPLEFKGIVYNEMKGALSSARARIMRLLDQTLFPDLTYGHDSGGDPKEIPSLTYEELLEFHKTFYHPSRCLFFFYGNMPLKPHLDFIAEHAFTNVKKEPQLPPMPPQPRFHQPKRVESFYPLSPDEGTKEKTLIAFGWLTCSVKAQDEVLALSIIETILMDTDASPLKLALLKSGLCKQVSSYMEADISEIPIALLLEGCHEENADALEEIIKNSLKDIVKQGIPKEMIENAMHQMEFHRSEITGNHTPFGLSLFMRSALMKQHGAKPEDGLKIHSLFDDLRYQLEVNPTYLTDLIQKYFLDNTHFVRVIMMPDTTLAKKEVDEERQTLDYIREKLTPEQTDELVTKANAFAIYQKAQKEQNEEVLPKVTLKDVSKTPRVFDLKQEKIGNLNLFSHHCFTNKIIYAELFYDLPDIPEEDLSYVRLFTILLHQMGCGGRDYIKNLEYQQAHTGGVRSSLSLSLQASDFNRYIPSFSLRGKALHRKASYLFSLFNDMLTSCDFSDLPRLKEVILKHFTALQTSLNQSAMRYAINLSTSGLTIPSKISNDWTGLEYYWKIQDLAQNFDEKSSWLLAKLQELQSTLLCLDNPHLVLTCEKEMYEKLKKENFYGLATLPTKAYKPWKGNFSLTKVHSQGRLISSPVAFISKAFTTIPYNHPDSAAINIAAHLFDNLTLHSKVREQGGAYDGGAVSNSLSGHFYFYSYRDPNISKTLEAFSTAISNLSQGKFTDQNLEEAKLEMIQAMDAPIAPGSRGEVAYSLMREGKTFEIRQAFRTKLLDSQKKDVVEATKRHIAANYEKGITIVFAGKQQLEKENERLVSQGKETFPLEPI